MSEPVLRVEDLGVRYRSREGTRIALHGVDLKVQSREIVGIVGESGCGKSTLASVLLRLLPPNGEITSGRVQLAGCDVLRATNEQLRDLRGRGAAMIFQDPLTSLNPGFRIGTQMVDAQLAHRGRDADRDTARARAVELLRDVGLPDAETQLDRYPHQFSGGMRQRIMIAMALSLRPELLIADEPTSALDVTTAAQILELLRGLRDQHGTSILMVSHELGAIAQICDRVVVMYAGRVVEHGESTAIFATPRHPYTRALLETVPSPSRRGQRLRTIPGRVTPTAGDPTMCVFADRCPDARDVCRQREPAMLSAGTQRVRCFRYDAEAPYGPRGAPEEEVAR